MDEITQALKYLSGALKMKALYPPGHPAIHRQVEKSYRLIVGILNTMKKLTISIVDDLFIVQDEPLYEASDILSDFISKFLEKGVERVTFVDGLTLNELVVFYDLLILSAEEVESAGGLKKALGPNQVVHIIIEKLEKEKKELDQAAKQVYSDAIDVVADLIAEARLGNIPKADKAGEVVSEMVEVVLEDKSAILGLSMIKSYDDYLFNHSVNVSILSVSLGAELELSQSTLNELGIGALLHDIGKVNTPEEIVKKAGDLNEQEWAVMKQHPLFGYEMLSRMKDVTQLSANIALEHHLRYNGVGSYPEEAAARTPHPCSQIVTVGDCYDAITTLRPFREPSDTIEGLNIMDRLSGKTINPEYHKPFAKMLGVYPVGTLVRLDTNEIAVITRPNENRPIRPTIKVAIDREGRRLDEPFEADLTQTGEGGKPVRTIIGTVDPVLRNIDVADYLGT